MLSTWFQKLTQRILLPSLSWVLPVKGVYFYETDAVENHACSHRAPSSPSNRNPRMNSTAMPCKSG